MLVGIQRRSMEDRLPREITNRPDLVWVYGFVRLGIPVMYIAVIIGMAVALGMFRAEPALAILLPLCLIGLIVLDRSALLDPIARIRLGQLLHVHRVVAQFDIDPRLIKAIEIRPEDSSDYADGRDKKRTLQVKFVVPGLYRMTMTVTSAAADELMRWAHQHSVPVRDESGPERLGLRD